MLRLEWIARLFSIAMAMLLGIVLSPTGTNPFLELFFWANLLYAIFLLFKKFIYPWVLGAYYNLIIEAIELAILIYIHSVSSSPLVIILFISFMARMRFIYENKIFLIATMFAPAFFIFTNFYKEDAGYRVDNLGSSIYFALGFAFLIWILWELYSFITGLEEANKDLKDVLAVKDVLINELNVSRDKLLKTNDQLYVWANTDSLTGLHNSRYFNRYWNNIYEQFEQLNQESYPITLIMMDIQGHKIYNSVYGHAAGDVLLQDLALILKACSSKGDIVVRYSDYVFAITLPGQEETGAEDFYRNLVQRLNEYSDKQPGMRNIEISLGWASCRDVTQQTKEELISRAINNARIID